MIDKSKIIRKRKFTPAHVHDSQVLEELLSGDERSKDQHKRISRFLGIYYGILDKKKRGKELSKKQEKRNKQKSSVRAAVEHPFALMRKKLRMGLATAKTKARNALRFDMNCILYNVLRAAYLLRIKTCLMGVVCPIDKKNRKKERKTRNQHIKK